MVLDTFVIGSWSLYSSTSSLERYFCGSDTATKVIKVDSLPDPQKISMHSSPTVCINTMYQVFGTDNPQSNGKQFTWSVTNGELFATAANRQNCIVNFIDSGKAVISLIVTYTATGCYDSAGYSVNVQKSQSPSTSVIYIAPEFFCLDSAATYQWGYDNKITHDTVVLNGQTNQNYYNANPDFKNYNYWVITTFGSCSQKSYLDGNTPTGTENLENGDGLGMELFPNPVSEDLYIHVTGMNSFDKLFVTVYDITGKSLLCSAVLGDHTNVNMSELNSGMYLVTLEQNGIKLQTKSVVK